MYEKIVLCQPDHIKSCTACCGLFNFIDISREHLFSFLSEGAARSSACITKGDSCDCGDREQIRDMTSYVCPHQGLLYNRQPGCLLHPRYRNNDMRNSAFFGETICNGFTCPAHSVLSVIQKRIIIDLLDDWFLYSVAIIDPGTTAWLLAILDDNYRVGWKRKKVVKAILDDCLRIHAGYMARYRGPIFFYSLPEYRLGKNGFSLPDCSGERMEETREIIETIHRYT
ncbi:MAG: hypothetical protein E4H15_05525 [Syntrophobacterales bacterium]|nr:MAG: hypothetical protein E4H15_05525 [Syntrophobacterales bacterium]